MVREPFRFTTTTLLPASLFQISLLLATLLLPTEASAEAQEFETPPVLQAADLIPAELLEGEHHRVEPEVQNDGLMNHFVIRSDFGDFEAGSTAMLEIRVQEVHALARLEEIKRREVFADALVQAAQKPIDAVKNVVSEPVDTAKKIPDSIGRAFKGLYYKGRKTAHKIGDKVEEAREKVKTNKDTEKSNGESTGEETEPKEAKDTETITRELAAKGESAAKSYFGFNSAVRDLARRLGVDPYTSNPVLRAELEKLARAAFLANLSFNMLMPSISALSTIEDIDELVYSKSSSELERLSDKALDDMGVPRATRLDFFANRRWTPAHEIRLLGYLQRLEGLDGREHVIELASSTESENGTLYFLGVARLLADYHEQIKPLRALFLAIGESSGHLIAAVDTDGALIVPAAVDYLTWRPGMETRGPLYEHGHRKLWLAGGISPRARQELEARDWQIHDSR